MTHSRTYTCIARTSYPAGDVQRSCGHNHKTYDAADRCLHDLRHPVGSNDCPAIWYNARVEPTNPQED